MSEQILTSNRLPWPTPWADIFARSAPLVMEIGFGGGDFLLHLARQRPFANIIGLEISLPSLRKAEKKRVRAGIDNVRVIQGGAMQTLWGLVEPESLEALYINFPDPWPKADHNGRRLINPDFLQLAASRLKQGGTLDIATDHPDYAQAITHCLQASPFFHSRHQSPFATEDIHRLRTKYEKIALEEGRTCHYYYWQRNSVPTPDVYPVPKELPMPHVLVETPLTLPEIRQQFAPQHHHHAEFLVKFTEIFVSAYDGKLLIEAYVKEEPYTQRIGLSIQERDGRTLFGLHDIGFPRPTSGIHWAVYQLAQWVLSLHPSGKIVQTNLQFGPPVE